MKIINLEQTCEAFPSQWEGRLNTGEVIYIRYRHGTLHYGIGENLDKAISHDTNVVYKSKKRGGVMSTNEMLRYIPFDLEIENGN